MASQVWEYDGTPHLIFNPNDLPEMYTDIRPPDGLYYPIHFNEETREWFGTAKTVWEQENAISTEELPNDIDSLKSLIQLQTLQMAKLSQDFQKFKEELDNG